MITVCEKCERGLAGQQVTMCSDCGSEYHQRCWDALDECKRCAIAETVCFACGGDKFVEISDEMGLKEPCPNCNEHRYG
jgi:hypothetical protein